MEKSVFCTLTKGNFYSQNSAYRIGKLKDHKWQILNVLRMEQLLKNSYSHRGWTIQGRCQLEGECFVTQPKEVKKLIWNLQRSWASISNCFTMTFGTLLPQVSMKNPSLPFMLTRIANWKWGNLSPAYREVITINFPALIIDYFRPSVYLIFKRDPEPSPKCPVICISCIWSISSVWHKNSISYPLCRCWGSLWRKSSPANRGFLVWKTGSRESLKS